MKQHRTSVSSQDKKANKPSVLLTNEENDLVFELLGRKCLTLTSAVVQLFTTEPPLHSQWLKRYTGALCFVKDSVKRSYFCRLYCLMRNELVWEQEMYDNIKIYQLHSYLLAFEGHDNLVALNFAAEDEADDFFKTATTVIGNRSRRREEKRVRVKKTPPPRPTTAAPPPRVQVDENLPPRNNNQIAPVNHITSTPLPPVPIQQINFNEKKKGAKRLTKADIGLPTNFKHVTHVGWTAQRGFDLTGDDVETLKPFLQKAGVSDQQLNDSETRAFIYDFIQNHNVLESVKSESQPKSEERPHSEHANNNNNNNINHKQHTRAPPRPQRSSSTVSQTQRLAPPPPPSRPPAPAPPPSRNPPPPPVSRPPPPVIVANSMTAPPPPPPPPPPVVFAAPPPPPPISNEDTVSNKSNTLSEGVPDLREQLMDSIKKGKALRKVDQAPSPSLSSGGGDKRDNLLSEIRQGFELRPAAARELNSSPANRESNGAGTDALADALRRALLDRGRVIHSSDDDSDESSENENEWDD